ncbi:MAG: hypothetical protein P0S95_01460 [Rhabdochlamydiaceae bacterium]|nr:hypothetical protein [Candidatus Amphrikana amoebophyrae]
MASASALALKTVASDRICFDGGSDEASGLSPLKPTRSFVELTGLGDGRHSTVEHSPRAPSSDWVGPIAYLGSVIANLLRFEPCGHPTVYPIGWIHNETTPRPDSRADMEVLLLLQTATRSRSQASCGAPSPTNVLPADAKKA